MTAVTAVAVLTLVTIAQSPSAKAGAGADTKPVPHTTAAARNAVLTTPVAMTGAATAPPPTPTPTPTPTTTPPAPTRTATAVDVRRAVARAVTALPGSRTGDFAVGVTALDGGVVATYDSDAGDDFFDTASIVKVDILAALLLDAQHDGRPLTAAQRRLATAMIEWSDNSSALALWRTIGRAPGLNAANRTLGLQRTWGGPGDLWGLTQTTAHDQLTLLRAVFGDDSPLSATSRTYVKGLMRSVTSGQRWGVSAANRGPDSDARGYALKNGWLRRTATGLWDINSIGEVTYRGHRLLISVLSSGQRSQAAGIDLVEDMALAAAKAYTAAGTAG
ncbi:serine hydrolase [Streptomyces sp.]|uniref:serine hydrolase n=1 Tax=Streptomyces sp. TaxID=1931 RepID=UPI002F40F175